MMLLDTNVISDIRKVKKLKSTNFYQWFEAVNISNCYLSVLTLYEIKLGILQKERKDPLQAEIIRNWFNTQILVDFTDRILPLDASTAINTAYLHVPNPASIVDSMIASTAIENNLTLVTRNVDDFESFPVTLINPYD